MMTAAELLAYREAAGITQTELADRIGLTSRPYQDIEGGRTKVQRRHVLAFERAALALALERGDINLAPPAIRRDALALARLITG
jgi:transcriptional regulator with XRE-family HTH domain